MLFGSPSSASRAIEYKDKFEEHHVPGASFSFDHVDIPGHPDQYANPQHAQIFFALYFIMTGLHALHMIIGLGIFTWLLCMAWKGRFTPNITRLSKWAASTGTSSTSSGSTCSLCST